MPPLIPPAVVTSPALWRDLVLVHVAPVVPADVAVAEAGAEAEVAVLHPPPALMFLPVPPLVLGQLVVLVVPGLLVVLVVLVLLVLLVVSGLLAVPLVSVPVVPSTAAVPG